MTFSVLRINKRDFLKDDFKKLIFDKNFKTGEEDGMIIPVNISKIILWNFLRMGIKIIEK